MDYQDIWPTLFLGISNRVGTLLPTLHVISNTERKSITHLVFSNCVVFYSFRPHHSTNGHHNDVVFIILQSEFGPLQL